MSGKDFKTVAEANKSTGLVRDFWSFLRTNKKFWLLPVILMMLLLGALVMLSGTGAAPFIYTLF